MQTLLILISAIALVLFVAVFAVLFLVLKRTKEIKEISKSDKAVDLLSQNIKSIQERIDDSYKENVKIVREVTQGLERLDSTNKQVVGFADQLQKLQDILQNPKQRGVLGEYYLETLLKNIFSPNQYKMQYKFKNGDIVDAVIFVKDKIIPIDSKFSLENYNRMAEVKDKAYKEPLEKKFKQDLKFRIDETSKYIKPSEGTTDFAFMFIPSEGIFYDLLINQVGTIGVNTSDLIEYAFKKKVIIVSPTSFYAYLSTVLQGLRALQIEESAKEIRKHVEKLSKHLITYDEFMKKLGDNLGTTVGMYNKAYKEFQKIDKDVVKITEDEARVEAVELEKPNIE